MSDLGYRRPASVDEAVALAGGDPAARFLAGGTELVPWMRQGLARPGTLVDISRLPLAAIEREGDRLRIGALTRLADVGSSEEVRRAAPALVRAIELAASPQLRHMATLGGNLLQETRCPAFRAGPGVPCNRRAPGTGCPVASGGHRGAAILGGTEACVAVHPSDPAVALAALEARVTIVGPNGGREATIESLLAGGPPDLGVRRLAGDLLTAVVVPVDGLAERSVFLKVRDRAAYDFALVAAAASVRVSGGQVASARLALGGVAPWPWRCRVAEARLVGGPADAAAFRAALGAELAAATPVPGNRFKVDLAIAVGARALEWSARSGW